MDPVTLGILTGLAASVINDGGKTISRRARAYWRETGAIERFNAVCLRAGTNIDAVQARRYLTAAKAGFWRRALSDVDSDRRDAFEDLANACGATVEQAEVLVFQFAALVAQLDERLAQRVFAARQEQKLDELSIGLGYVLEEIMTAIYEVKASIDGIPGPEAEADRGPTQLDPRANWLSREASATVLRDVLQPSVDRVSAMGIGDVFAISGLPGVGKSTLARQVCTDETVIKHYLGRIHWTSVSVHSEREDALLDLHYRATGRSPTTRTSLIEELTAFLRANQPTLIVVDGADVPWADELVADLKPSASVLVTRQRVDGRQDVTLEPFSEGELDAFMQLWPVDLSGPDGDRCRKLLAEISQGHPLIASICTELIFDPLSVLLGATPSERLQQIRSDIPTPHTGAVLVGEAGRSLESLFTLAKEGLEQSCHEAFDSLVGYPPSAEVSVLDLKYWWGTTATDTGRIVKALLRTGLISMNVGFDGVPALALHPLVWHWLSSSSDPALVEQSRERFISSFLVGSNQTYSGARWALHHLEVGIPEPDLVLSMAHPSIRPVMERTCGIAAYESAWRSAITAADTTSDRSVLPDVDRRIVLKRSVASWLATDFGEADAFFPHMEWILRVRKATTSAEILSVLQHIISEAPPQARWLAEIFYEAGRNNSASLDLIESILQWADADVPQLRASRSGAVATTLSVGNADRVVGREAVLAVVAGGLASGALPKDAFIDRLYDSPETSQVVSAELSAFDDFGFQLPLVTAWAMVCSVWQLDVRPPAADQKVPLLLSTASCCSTQAALDLFRYWVADGAIAGEDIDGVLGAIHRFGRGEVLVDFYCGAAAVGALQIRSRALDTARTWAEYAVSRAADVGVSGVGSMEAIGVALELGLADAVNQGIKKWVAGLPSDYLRSPTDLFATISGGIGDRPYDMRSVLESLVVTYRPRTSYRNGRFVKRVSGLATAVAERDIRWSVLLTDQAWGFASFDVGFDGPSFYRGMVVEAVARVAVRTADPTQLDRARRMILRLGDAYSRHARELLQLHDLVGARDLLDVHGGRQALEVGELSDMLARVIQSDEMSSASLEPDVAAANELLGLVGSRQALPADILRRLPGDLRLREVITSALGPVLDASGVEAAVDVATPVCLLRDPWMTLRQMSDAAPELLHPDSICARLIPPAFGPSDEATWRLASTLATLVEWWHSPTAYPDFRILSEWLSLDGESDR